ncbi:phosphatidylinositol glycan, class L [Dictyostelium discoideum AX4]|uniref:Probable N-acetylglucosaminyl-phosphatidylinositol de-N-acetylase n=1 Tax=Dictyostelium discoideum TaxID=44689 RepID=PIGL_DICDI|nr:phosphatidylinositol glycan, class L [Dictyostelium discoideum AX4]Q54C64.1 RecName: Full=Probable N-acetylglucosaminyl-phosphatidylinositol de-N-acetylase; AltName: Full=Phosphatidylinositol-glycan biosynthesis class L protein; Short=PIG-L [Dictyostelium discoideum]EAL60920.1 phosphatidylinositol glycan, class L [Dictyostelium discoideum AX4]|eukprot:XP_629355.1 phosphatidylinositol glycan, class L [Dictyostelium discoideum AX4]
MKNHLNNNEDNSTLIKKKVLFVIAHPDDECMFFTPTIQHYNFIGSEIFVACLSNGNAVGLGKIREKELIDSCIDMGINQENVFFDQTNNFQDGMNIIWDTDLVEKTILSFIKQTSADIVISFDECGISSHPNHISISNGLKQLMKNKSSSTTTTSTTSSSSSSSSLSNRTTNNLNKEIKAYKLETVNIIRKYIGIADIPLTKLLSYDENSTQTFISTQLFPPSSYSPMTKHKSQFVWFRYLFVFLSRYSFINTLIEIK